MSGTVNPYRNAAMLIALRLAWDLDPRSWQARRRLKRLRDTHRGEKAVILCNGPSLLKVDFDRLSASRVYTFGLNKINMLYDKTDHRPSSIVSVNRLVIEQNLAFFNETDTPLFMDSMAVRQGLKTRGNVYYLNSTPLHGTFARDVSMSLFQGHTVTYVALQVAFHLGFQQVALVGCDHNFATKGPANKTVTGGESDPNHFDPNYFAGVKWQLPDLVESEMAYFKALQVYEEAGRSLYNCTEGGKLEILPRKPLPDFLDE
ncbi:DUF115 domain-containing protein [Aquisalimonas lutea]|uniref:6-hydroxymethylpterin diphosphokinase MptE-like protein n=1 Tax=Aquisalimonas lutea TaxID=1327750 RepID=UPI0025B62325|nr:6-hydroxymethylpterin diphosphokinase MptE-like protein [Aquisalimonas lutea]MDN3517821.1 DUF115 domain-containing protein [Aquisalimonas lutea]